MRRPIPGWVGAASREQIADYFVRQIEVGQDGVRAGVIGELMSHNEPVADPRGYRLHEPERRVFEAAAWRSAGPESPSRRMPRWAGRDTRNSMCWSGPARTWRG